MSAHCRTAHLFDNFDKIIMQEFNAQLLSLSPTILSFLMTISHTYVISEYASVFEVSLPFL